MMRDMMEHPSFTVDRVASLKSLAAGGLTAQTLIIAPLILILSLLTLTAVSLLPLPPLSLPPLPLTLYHQDEAVCTIHSSDEHQNCAGAAGRHAEWTSC